MSNQTQFRGQSLRISFTFVVSAVAMLRVAPAAAHAGLGASAPPAIERSVAAPSASATGAIAPERTIAMIDAGTKMTLLKAFVLPPGHSSVTLGSGPSGSVLLGGLSRSDRSQVVPAGTTFVTSSIARCYSYEGRCYFSYEGTSVTLVFEATGSAQRSPYSVLARDFASASSDFLSIEVPAPVVYGGR